MNTSLDISSDGKHTGALLQQYLTDRNVYSPQSKAVVCYGMPHRTGRYTINGNRKPAGKINNMRYMNEGGCRTVPWFQSQYTPTNGDGITFPLLARKAHGMGGKDIVPVFQPEEIPWRVAAGWEWFSSYVPVAKELRIWMWRGQVLDTFEKVMSRPAAYKGIGRNFDNGFDFVLTGTHTEATAQSALALTAIGLDFGAVDLLVGKDGLTYVLEVNTAPGALKSGAYATVAKLADRIEEWCKGGYPERGGA